MIYGAVLRLHRMCALETVGNSRSIVTRGRSEAAAEGLVSRRASQAARRRKGAQTLCIEILLRNKRHAELCYDPTSYCCHAGQVDSVQALAAQLKAAGVV